MKWPLLLSIFGVLVVVAAIMFFYAYKSEKAAIRHLGVLAKKLGLTFNKGSLKHEPSLTGTYQSFPIVVQSVILSAQPPVYATNYSITLTGEHIPPDMIVYREGLMAKISKVFGGEDIQIEDPELDKAFIIKGVSQDAARMFFARPEIKNCFLEMLKTCDVFRLEDKTLNIEFPHRLLEAVDQINEHLDRVITYAQIINGSAANARQASMIPADPDDLLGESTTLEVFMPPENDLQAQQENTLT